MKKFTKKCKIVREVILRMHDDNSILRRQRWELRFQSFGIEELGEEHFRTVGHDTDLIFVRHRGEHDVASLRLVRQTLEEIAVRGGLD